MTKHKDDVHRLFSSHNNSFALKIKATMCQQLATSLAYELYREGYQWYLERVGLDPVLNDSIRDFLERTAKPSQHVSEHHDTLW
jgi:hypothetical protein